MKKILFINNGISPKLKSKKQLKSFLASIFKSEKKNFEKISYIFCKDEFLLSLNQNYLSHDTYTDILTFDLSENGKSITSEIYISVERVVENAISLEESYYKEILRVMIHGILHLCGYSDYTILKKSLMREKEDFYLAKFCFT